MNSFLKAITPKTHFLRNYDSNIFVITLRFTKAVSKKTNVWRKGESTSNTGKKKKY